MTAGTKRIGALSLIILLHIAFFYVLQNGLVRQTIEAPPRELAVTLLAPEPKLETVPEPQSQPIAEPPKPKAVHSPIPIVKSVKPSKPLPAPSTRVADQKPVPTPEPRETAPVATAVAAPAPPAAAPATATTPAPPVAQQAAAAPEQPKTVSGVQYIRAPQPEYPSLARRNGETGRVLLRVLVNEAGRAERADVQTSSGSSRLDEAARQAALRALFKPHLEDGNAVAVYALVPINFSIQ